MQIKPRTCDVNNTENMSPASAVQGKNLYPERDLGLNLLGIDYERKKQKLQQELQLDYELFLSKTKDRKTSEPCLPPQGLSLPIDDRTSVKERPASQRDAATLTEAVDNGKSTGSWGPGYRRRRRWQLYRRKEPCSSEEELSTDEEWDSDFRYRRRQDRRTRGPEYKEERRKQERRVNRDSQDIKDVEAPVVRDQNSNDGIWKSELQMLDNMRMAAKSTPGIGKEKPWFATGLMIGATEDQTAAQMKKEQYGQELLRQIAEKQRNKMMERTLELRVAATGATDPEKEPDRIKQLGGVNLHYDSLRWDVPHKPGIEMESEGKDLNRRPKDDKPSNKTEQMVPRGKSEVTVPRSGMRAAQGFPSLDYFSEDYHRHFSNTLGEVAIQRVSEVAPPVPPIVPNTYKTPYDAAYYYYGTRNPLDPNLPYNQNGLSREIQQSENFKLPFQNPRLLRTSGTIKATRRCTASPLAFDELHEDKSKQRRESVLSYQEALRQQIRENEERKRREKDEEMRYDAKKEAEMMAYNPWGRSGGGAPIKDQKGNLVSDLHQMHKTNEKSNKNPVDARVLLSHRLSGSDDPPQELHMQHKHQEALKRQIEERKRNQAEERERIRIGEEEEEKRLARQRAHIQQEYEDEQKKQNKTEHRLENQSRIHQPKRHYQEEENTVRQEKETGKMQQSATTGEEEISQLNYEREPSPPIPTLRKKQTGPVASRPSSAVSQLSSRNLSQKHPMSAPHHRPVSPKTPQLDDDQQEVIRQLSRLRRHLRNEQRQLQAQMDQTSPSESPYTPPNRQRRRPRDAAAERGNMQNIREFTQLKHRDTSSREGVRATYPDPPTDAQSLDIQQQALLREQERKIRLMNRQKEHDFMGKQQDLYDPRRKPGSFIQRDSVLPSQSAFMDVYSGDACDHQRSSQSSAEHRERTAPRGRHNRDVGDSIDQREHDNQSEDRSLQSDMTLNLRSEVRDHNHHHTIRGDTSGRTERLSPDEVDVLSLRSALGRRVSVETVATEPWLRPGTADAVKHCREMPKSRTDAPWLTHRIT
ncbi:centrosome and spindle pole associated protein 1 isoform X2 [Acanthochromis polyacanthus]|uniref:centrosome and spindle pole associated protein 1 isoform X2 n=1 Tax=Acanthochromis polyacanthus TaxID=80966 RepID=UPI0022347F2F|nr:centrosome and spindle pole associated protein 1 isoform X2 [Acanthochromis polyacanthus]